MPPKHPHLRSGPNDARDEAAQLVASGQEGGQVELEQVPVAVRGVQLLAELQHLLLQGVEAAQAALALLPPQPLLLRLPQALLLCLAQLQVEDLGKGPAGDLSVGLPGFLFLHASGPMWATGFRGWARSRKRPGSVVQSQDTGQVLRACLPGPDSWGRSQPDPETPAPAGPDSDLCSVPMLSFQLLLLAQGFSGAA